MIRRFGDWFDQHSAVPVVDLRVRTRVVVPLYCDRPGCSTDRGVLFGAGEHVTLNAVFGSRYSVEQAQYVAQGILLPEAIADRVEFKIERQHLTSGAFVRLDVLRQLGDWKILVRRGEMFSCEMRVVREISAQEYGGAVLRCERIGYPEQEGR